MKETSHFIVTVRIILIALMVVLVAYALHQYFTGARGLTEAICIGLLAALLTGLDHLLSRPAKEIIAREELDQILSGHPDLTLSAGIELDDIIGKIGKASKAGSDARRMYVLNFLHHCTIQSLDRVLLCTHGKKILSEEDLQTMREYRKEHFASEIQILKELNSWEKFRATSRADIEKLALIIENEYIVSRFDSIWEPIVKRVILFLKDAGLDEGAIEDKAIEIINILRKEDVIKQNLRVSLLNSIETEISAKLV